MTALFVARLNESKLGVLPDSMLTSVFEYLHTTEFTPVMPVSREWARLSASDELWKPIYARRFYAGPAATAGAGERDAAGPVNGRL